MTERSATGPSGTTVETARDFATHMFAVADAELRKLAHDPWEVLSRAIQPVLWLVLFGEVMAQVRGFAAEGQRYLDFLVPGILAQSVVFVSIFNGIAAIWERDLGVLHRYMISPAPRSALVLGKALSSSVRALTQAIVVYICATMLDVQLSFSLLHIGVVVLLIVLGAGLFSTLSLIIACIVRRRERFMAICQVLAMPIFFASNAIYSIGLMPAWLKAIASANPLTYEVDGLRAMMLANGASTFGLGVDFLALTIAFSVAVIVATRLYPRLTR